MSNCLDLFTVQMSLTHVMPWRLVGRQQGHSASGLLKDFYVGMHGLSGLPLR